MQGLSAQNLNDGAGGAARVILCASRRARAYYLAVAQLRTRRFARRGMQQICEFLYYIILLLLVRCFGILT